MKRLILAACLLAFPAVAQTPFGFSGLTTGVAPGPNVQPLTASGLNEAGGTKADNVNGTLVTPSIFSGILTTPAIATPSVTGTLTSVNVNLFGNAAPGSWIYSIPGASFATSNATFAAASPFGASAVQAYTRASDNTQPGLSQSIFAIGSFAINDSLDNPGDRSVYAAYLEARKSAGSLGTAQAAELSINNQGTVTTRSPFTVLASGDTIGLLIGAGRTDLAGIANSTALAVLGGSVSGPQAQTGVIVQQGAVAPDNGRGFGFPMLFDVPSTYGYVWEDRSAGLPSAWVYANVAHNGTGGGGVFIGDAGVTFQDVNKNTLMTVNATSVQTPEPVTINNSLTVQSLTTSLGGIQTSVRTIATLGACSSANEGQLWYVSDAASIGTVGSGGGSARIPVYCNGTAWTSPSSDAPLSAATTPLGGTALAAGACITGTVAVASATTSMVVVATPATYPGDGAVWSGYVSATGMVTVRVCAIAAVTPVASAYNVRVVQ